ncbi:YopX family protein [Bacillus cereus group sp. BfR-BA-01423]|uniref:YopX family protein n=1 Tax=Bacillus cereus group sp. BfR-BA-01423 TaxID=2920340 RepID=UPI001F572AB5|nr:YopX family protein [Bacillus cereus group sp. BfR-BA-01423]
MKKIEFKAFDKVIGKMYDVGYIDFANEVVQVAMIKGGICYGTYVRRLKDVALLQYTGLKDKNGNKIFDGDIVRVSAHPFDIDSNYEVGYNEYMELSCGSYYLSKMRSWAEVIGNIYESPELLEN